MALGVVAAYAPAWRAPFVFDDIPSIQDNATIRSLSPGTALAPPGNDLAVSGRPIVNYTLAVNHGLNRLLGVDQRPDPDGPFKTVGYRLFNVALHLVNGLLLFLLVRSTLSRRDELRLEADWIALAVASVFLLHPLQSEAVSYVIQRTELIASACYLGTLLCAARAWEDNSRRAWSAAAIAICLAGMASKETVATAPLVVMLYDRAFMAPSWRALLERRDRVALYAGLWATTLWVVGTLLTGARTATVGFDSGIAWYEYLYSQCWAIAHYLRLTLIPVGLTLDYGDLPVRDWRGIPGAVLMVGLALLTLHAWVRRRMMGLAFLGACFFILLAPSSSVVPIASEIAAERRFYLPIACVIIAAVVLARRHLVQALAGAIVLFGVLTFLRAREYRDPLVLWQQVIERVPGNPRGHLGAAYVLARERPPRLPEADQHLRRALSIDPDFTPALDALATIQMKRGQLSDASHTLERRLLAGDSPRAAALLGMVLVGLGDTAKAKSLLDAAELDDITMSEPDGSLVLGFAGANMAVGNWAKAVVALKRAHEWQPERVDILLYLSDALQRTGRTAEARAYLERARALARLQGRGP